jgi:hypothetical protein
MNDQLQTTLRLLLKVGGGMLAQKGLTTDSGWSEISGALMVIAGFIWGLYHRTPKIVVAASGEPAKAGTPSGPPLTGPFQSMVAFALVMACFAGCVNRPQVSTVNGVMVTNFVKGPDIARISRLSGTAAQLGSLAWLSKNPGDRAYFATANEALKGLINSGNYDPAAFASALQGLPIKELKGSEGSLYISVAIVVWDEAIQSAQGLDRQELVAATLKAVQQGIQRTLDATAPKAELEGDDGKSGRGLPQSKALRAGILMPRWRPALQPAEAYALVTFRN